MTFGMYAMLFLTPLYLQSAAGRRRVLPVSSCYPCR